MFPQSPRLTCSIKDRNTGLGFQKESIRAPYQSRCLLCSKNGKFMMNVEYSRYIIMSEEEAFDEAFTSDWK